MRLSVALLVATLACGCKGQRESDADAAPSGQPTSSAPAAAASASPTPGASASAASSAPAPLDPAAEAKLVESAKACAERRKAALAEPALPGAETFEKERLHFARVRGRALLWRRVPGKLAPEITDAVEHLGKKEKVLDAVRKVEAKAKTPEARRDVFLRDGYLWADDVELGLALVEQLSLAELFEEKTIFLQRGVDVFELERHEKTRWFPERYLYKDGPYAGMSGELLLGDRVATKREELGANLGLAVDLRDLAEQASFDRIKPVHFAEKHLVADLRYGPDAWVPALIDLDGAKATVACEELTPELERKRRAFVEERALLLAAMNRVRGVVRAMVREEIPFDAAPNQTNGFLRRDWRKAYLQGKTRFASGSRHYDVYDREGRPRPPQVCIDFLTDVWERASGTWFDPADVEDPYGERPKITVRPKFREGAINFDRMKIRNRRSVARFERFTAKNDELFDVWEIPKKERHKFEDRKVFHEYLAEKADMLRVGDMLIIHGFKEGGRPHYHSLLVTETDPITGVVTLIASNAVKPREQTLEGIMHISPERTLRTRIRVKRPWLEIVKQAADKPL